jgi:tetratricopeptide (TPR) repeat protein
MKITRIPLAIALALGITFTGCEMLQNEKKARELNEQGLALYNQGDSETALQKMKEAAALEGIQPETQGQILRNISIVFNSQEQNDSARYYSNKAALLAAEGSYERLVNQADVQIYDGDLEGAVASLEEALSKKKDDLAVYNSLGLIYLGEYDESFADIEKALTYNQKAFDISPDRNSQYVLALNLFDLDRFDEAEAHLRTLTDRYPGFADQHYLLGMAQYRQGKAAHAEIAWARALAIDTSYTESIETYKILYGSDSGGESRN